MRALKRQFLLDFAVMGSAVCYVPVILSQRLADHTQVGQVLSLTGVAVIVTPVLMTLLADAHAQTRTLIAALFGLSTITLGLLTGAHGFWSIAAAYAVFALAFWPLNALQDGLYFSVSQQRGPNLPAVPYHAVRVYGTVGFVLPVALLYVLMRDGAPADVALSVGGAISILGLINAFSLPSVQVGQNGRSEKTRRMPTMAAARRLFRGSAVVFCACLFSAHLANAAYYSFYPLYLTEQVGFAEKWVGPIIMLGVVLEIGVMIAVGALIRKMGLKWVLVLGLLFMALRLALLGLAPSKAMAVATQACHGMSVVALYVLPPIYLNSLAGDTYRSSIQGLYAMTVFGPARIIGPSIAGYLADQSMLLVFTAGAVVTAVVIAVVIALLDAPSQSHHSTGQAEPSNGLQP